MKIDKKYWRIDLVVGSSFVYKGDYCTVTKMKKYHFQYEIQNSNVNGFMHYDHYITIPSFIAKQRFFPTKK
jgi:hypothetical protein